MEHLIESKWSEVLEAPTMPKITNSYKKNVTAHLLENQEKFLKEDAVTTSSLPGGGAVGSNWDPILISMVRRMAPRLIAYDVCGVQPMTAPTGLIFAVKSRYTTAAGVEALGLDEPNSGFGGNAVAMDVSNPFLAAFNDGTAGMSTATAEADTTWEAMNMSYERVSVTAQSRQLRADWGIEMAQDLKAVHGLDADAEMSSMLATELTAEINREMVRRLYTIAKIGAQGYTTAAGIYDMANPADADGRWSDEKFKNLLFVLEREANQIAIETRRGKGNIVITSANVASALVLAGILNYTPALEEKINLEVDVTGVTYAGDVGRFKVYVDPYLTHDGLLVGYKGANQYDAGMFYCPYVPLQMLRAINPTNFQPAIGFKTRYGIVSNPFTSLTKNGNVYYRKLSIANL